MSTELPIMRYLDDIVASVRNNQVTIVIGETGCGKTAFIPQALYKAGFARNGRRIVVTEPRRIAAAGPITAYVAKNLGVTGSRTVGHHIRFSNTTGPETAIEIMTDGVLLRMLKTNPLLLGISVVMIDEAHEQSNNIFLLHGLLKQALAKRPDLRLIISSATIDTNKPLKYYRGAVVIKVEGRHHNVEVIFSDVDVSGEERIPAIIELIRKALASPTCPDLLVFLTGLKEIEQMAAELQVIPEYKSLVVLRAHSSVSKEQQDKIFLPYPGKRKVVLATNIAETSITINNVDVIDGGLVKQIHFDPRIGIPSLDVVVQPQDCGEQRWGRAGRTRDGTCYCLYTKENYLSRPRFTEPEIKRSPLGGLVLNMLAMGMSPSEVMNFDFMDPPSQLTLSLAFETLKALGAIEADNSGLTKLGKMMAALPLEPLVSYMLLKADAHGCIEEMATIAAFVSATRSAFIQPTDWDEEVEKLEVHEQFDDTRSDMLTVLNVWRAYQKSGCNKQWCRNNFLSPSVLDEVGKIRDQLLQILKDAGMVLTWCDYDSVILRTIADGLSYNLLQQRRGKEYGIVGRKSKTIHIHPKSSVSGNEKAPEMIVSAKLLRTSRKNFARWCSVVELEHRTVVAEEILSHEDKQRKIRLSRREWRLARTHDGKRRKTRREKSDE